MKNKSYSFSFALLLCFLGCGNSSDTPESAFQDGSVVQTDGSSSTAPDVESIQFGDASFTSREGGSSIPSTDVEVEITSDNAYGFGWGTEGQLLNYYTKQAAALSSEIFSCPVGNGPEHFLVPASESSPSHYLYAIAWDDLLVTQGLIAQFRRAQGTHIIYSGAPEWEVCATGVLYNAKTAAGKPGPSKTIIEEQLAICNAGTGNPATSSKGWVNTLGPVTAGALGTLAVGEDNSSQAGMPIVCQQDDAGNRGIDPAAKWMWYRAPAGCSGEPISDPFRSNSTCNSSRQFLIFRLKASAVSEGR